MITQENGGIIITQMNWKKPKWWLFNIVLFIYQIFTLSWVYRFDREQRIILLSCIPIYIIAGICNGSSHWWIGAIGWIALFMILFVLGPIKKDNKKPIRNILFSAQTCHMRTCIERVGGSDVFEYLTFSYPNAKYDYWKPSQIINSKYHFYKKPKFKTDKPFGYFLKEFSLKLIGDVVRKKYDWLQLISCLVNLPIWLIFPKYWGKEVIRVFNFKGGRNFCSSGGTVLLRSAYGNKIIFFPEYDAAMVSPGLISISDLWYYCLGAFGLPEGGIYG